MIGMGGSHNGLRYNGLRAMIGIGGRHNEFFLRIMHACTHAYTSGFFRYDCED